MLRSAKGSRSASPHTAKLTDRLLARASSGAESRPIVVSSTPFSLATVRARRGMSPSPVPTSRRVARRGRLSSVSLISSSAELKPPKRALQRATSARDRVTTSGSTSGRSRISTPRRRGGVNIANILLALQLAVAAAIVQQGTSGLDAGPLYLPDDYRVIPTIVQRELAALFYRERVIKHGYTVA